MSASSSTSASTATPSTLAAGSSAETQAAAFASDPRIHFDTQSQTWKFEDDNGDELEYDAGKGAWVPVVDEELLKRQAAAYSIAGVDEEAPAAPVAKRAKKRKQPEDYTSATPDSGPISIKRGKNSSKPSASTSNGTGADAPPPKKSKNTAVFVTRLPLDATHEEIVSCFSKCGLIEEDDDGEPKVKMYARETDEGSNGNGNGAGGGGGEFSGEALVVYFKEDSVELAVNILDDTELRLGDDTTRMRVQRAEFGHKGEEGGGSGAPGSASGKGERTRKVVDKRKTTRRLGKMQKKLEEWDDEDNFGPSLTDADRLGPGPQGAGANPNSRVVVLRHMFTLEELEKDATLLLDLKEDVREECETLGEVTNVVLYDKEPEGIMTVKFRDPVSAQACVIKMNGRFFAGRAIEASLWAGKQRFKQSGKGGHAYEEETTGGDEGEKKRLDDFARWLLTEGD
ncbi:uncharacterized protein STEHIDRAFT_172176 [Stereum hirsutum FP-91666 SS1]|uniref:uncharacterized protein n=1 Tax=Stereum hirsutum (strain FP-91666) TaxID=721885 RepID=UPI0004449BD8|nr:uncharacterized protein STEHIDRAFT_172176 [Stereum hirsutum FP-91666 SS1]EIM81169.1 hypothetical protein STEHIDRAFT_172176 [Stereum hirsutum FP-91666 SS1]